MANRWVTLLLVTLTVPGFARGEEPRAASSASPNAPDIRIIRDVDYVQRSDGAQTADLYIPAGAGPFPGILMVHGGAWMAGNKIHASWHATRLAQRGFAVMAINYRLAPQHPFPAQLDDCRAALAWMVSAAKTHRWDVNRLGGYGYSAGGHLVCLLGMVEATAAVPLRAVVAGGAPCDFCSEPPESERLAYWLGGTRKDRPTVYRDASPTTHVTPAAPPVFFFHGQQDRLVPLTNPRRLQSLLQEMGVTTQMHVVADAGHLLAFRNSAAFEQSVEFLQRQLACPPEEGPADE